MSVDRWFGRPEGHSPGGDCECLWIAGLAGDPFNLLPYLMPLPLDSNHSEISLLDVFLKLMCILFWLVLIICLQTH
jgi:hypothetical protein